jgi:hypothetical protein
MTKDPRAAHRAFEMFGGADNVYKQMEARHASRALAESMANAEMGAARQSGTGPGGFDYQGFVRQGLSQGIPLGHLSAATQAIATGNQVNSPSIGETEDWTEQNGQAMRRRVFYDKKGGGIISSGDWSPAFRPPSGGRMTRINPQTGMVEIFEGLTALQQSKEVDTSVESAQSTENASDLLRILDQTPGVSGVSGAAGEAVSGLAAGAANFINNMAGEEIINPDVTEENLAQAFMGASPEQRSTYKTRATDWTTSVRRTMDLGKPSNADLAIAKDAAAALSLMRSPRSIQQAIEDLSYMDAKYRYIYERSINAPSRHQLHTTAGMKTYFDELVRSGVSKERALRMAKRVYRSLAETAPEADAVQ